MSPIQFVIIPLFAAFLTALLGRSFKRCGDCLAIAGTAILLWQALSLLPRVQAQGALIYNVGGWMPPIGICMVVDGLANFMLVVVILVSLLVMVYSISYMRRYTETWKFHALFMLMLAGMNGVILSGDLFNLYIFLEIASISGYALVSFGLEPEDLEASFKYLVMGSLASIFILLGIALLYGYVSTLNIADAASALSARPRGMLLGFISALFFAGFGLKAALMPFHAWLPDAHSSAPAPVSAALSGIFIKTVGIYALVRVFFNMLGLSIRMPLLLMALGIVSMAAGALLALGQKDIKRMFAYSSISQVGYIIFAFGIGTPLAILGGVFHLFNHAIFKSLLFLNAGAIEYTTGTRNLNKMGGLNSRLPVTGFTSLIGSMSISGVPPFGGFWSKLIIIIAGVQAGYTGLALVAGLVSIITLAYYLKFQTFAFFGQLNSGEEKIKEAPLSMKLSMIILAAACIVTGLLLVPSCRPFLQSAVNVIYGKH